MNRSLRPMANPLPGAGLWWETRASLAFVERNLYLVKRYWHLELAFLIFNVASAMSVLYIGEAQMQREAGSADETIPHRVMPGNRPTSRRLPVRAFTVESMPPLATSLLSAAASTAP